MNKILLIATFIPQEKEKYSRLLPPYGLLSIATPLIKKGYDVVLIDPLIDINYLESIKNIVKKDDVIFVGMTTYAGNNLSFCLELAEYIKSITKEIKIVFGGPFATSSPELCLKHSCIDYIIRGMGEKSVVPLAEGIKNNIIPNISNLCYKNEGKIVVRDNYYFDGDIDEIDFPALELWKDGIANIKYIPILSSRGCPRNCFFCYNNTFIGRKKWYGRSVENVLMEMEHWKNVFDRNEFYFVDDNFLVDTERSLKILNECFNRKYKIDGLIGHLFDWKPGILEIINRDNINNVAFAIESASPRIQKMLNKKLPLDKSLKLLSIFSEKKIKIIKTAFMFGFPTESDKDIIENIKLAHQIKKLNSKIRILAYIYNPQPMDDITLNHIVPNYNIDFSIKLLSQSDYTPIRNNFLSKKLRPWMNEEDIQFYSDFIKVWYFLFDFVVRQDENLDLDINSILDRNKRVYKLFAEHITDSSLDQRN